MKILSIVAGAATLAIAVTSTVADAGYYSNEAVTVYPNSSAYGNVGAARHSSDNSQSIGCLVWSANGAPLAACQAQDAAGNYAVCVSTAPNVIALAQSVNSTSNIYFSLDSKSNCVDVQVTNNSSNLYY